MKIIFAGTPEFAVPTLQALINSEHEVVAVYSQPDRPAGRGRKLKPSEVKQTALEFNIEVFQPETLKKLSAQQQLASLNADIMIVVAYGLMLPQIILDTPKYGCLNIHASILPRWRGAAPIQRAIEAGDPETGVTIMQMDIGLDTGDTLAMLTTEIKPTDSSQTLHDRLSKLGAKALLKTLSEITTDTLISIKQDESLVTYAHKLSKTEALIDWSQDAKTILRKVQSFNPWPVAFSQLNSKPLRIWQAKTVAAPIHNNSGRNLGQILAVNKTGIMVSTAQDNIILTNVQPTGKKSMPAYDFAQARDLIGKSFE